MPFGIFCPLLPFAIGKVYKVSKRELMWWKNKIATILNVIKKEKNYHYTKGRKYVTVMESKDQGISTLSLPIHKSQL